MTLPTQELVERLGDVLDIIVAAEAHFAQTEKHHNYYGDRHRAVNEAIAAIASLPTAQAADQWEGRREALPLEREGLWERFDTANRRDNWVEARSIVGELLADIERLEAALDHYTDLVDRAALPAPPAGEE